MSRAVKTNVRENLDPLAVVEVQPYNGAALARVRGEIDTSNVQDVEAALQEAGTLPGAGLVVDLSAVTYLNSATVKLLFELAERLRMRQQELRLVIRETAPMRRLFLMLRFDLVVPVHNSIEDAIAHMPTGRGAGGEHADAHAD